MLMRKKSLEEEELVKEKQEKKELEKKRKYRSIYYRSNRTTLSHDLKMREIRKLYKKKKNEKKLKNSVECYYY